MTIVARELKDGKRFYDSYIIDKNEPDAKSGTTGQLGDPQASSSANTINYPQQESKRFPHPRGDVRSLRNPFGSLVKLFGVILSGSRREWQWFLFLIIGQNRHKKRRLAPNKNIF